MSDPIAWSSAWKKIKKVVKINLKMEDFYIPTFWFPIWNRAATFAFLRSIRAARFLEMVGSSISYYN